MNNYEIFMDLVKNKNNPPFSWSAEGTYAECGISDDGKIWIHGSSVLDNKIYLKKDDALMIAKFLIGMFLETDFFGPKTFE